MCGATAAQYYMYQSQHTTKSDADYRLCDLLRCGSLNRI